MIKKTPVSILALVLSFATLGKISSGSYNNFLYYGFFALAIFALCLITARFATDTENTIKEATSPIVLPLTLLLPMGLAVINSYFFPVSTTITTVVWYILLLLAYFFNYLYLKFIFVVKDHKMIFPSIFVNLVGIDVLVLNAPATVSVALLKVIFIGTILTYVASIVFVSYCTNKYRNLNERTIPIYAIFLAPPSLITASGLKNGFFVSPIVVQLFLVLIILSLVIYIIAFVKTLPNFKNFVPTYGAFTFPIVISALALKLINGKLELNIGSFVTVYYFISAAVVLFIFTLYMKHILKK